MPGDGCPWLWGSDQPRPFVIGAMIYLVVQKRNDALHCTLMEWLSCLFVFPSHADQGQSA